MPSNYTAGGYLNLVHCTTFDGPRSQHRAIHGAGEGSVLCDGPNIRLERASEEGGEAPGGEGVTIKRMLDIIQYAVIKKCETLW